MRIALVIELLGAWFWFFFFLFYFLGTVILGSVVRHQLLRKPQLEFNSIIVPVSAGLRLLSYVFVKCKSKLSRLIVLVNYCSCYLIC